LYRASAKVAHEALQNADVGDDENGCDLLLHIHDGGFEALNEVLTEKERERGGGREEKRRKRRENNRILGEEEEH